MRILIATGIFKPEPGGPATYSAELAKRLHTSGHNVALITYSNIAWHELDMGYQFHITRIVRSGGKLRNYFNYFREVYRQMKDKDVIYTLDWFSAGLPVMIAAWLGKKKYIVRVGGGYIWEKYLAQGRPPITLTEFYERKKYRRYWIMFVLIRMVLHRAAHVVFNSDEQRELYEKYYKLPPSKTSTIFNPVPESKLGTLVKTYKNDYTNRDKEIVFVGRFIKMKNVESAVKAFAKLTDPTFKLVLIGEGPTEPILRNLVRELRLEDRVEFIPTMAQKDLYRRIANCSYFILPSWTDISPNQIYECMAFGIPFLLTQENYLSINKYNFLKIDPKSVDDIAEKMNRLLDPKQYAAFVESLSHISVTNSWSHVVLEHLKLFHEYS
ncbi:glycosyltransferase family 4 protein [Candidatus Parcubacteria bacterium]|nr:glycosyltransferase family 4 protein [Candidatus Parcubacteria bacterium]